MRLVDQLSEPDEYGCRRWTGRKASSGYGAVKIDGKEHRVHRLIYAEEVGVIPNGCVIDHTCHNEAVRRGQCSGGDTCIHRPCGEPSHLIATDHQHNIAEGALGYANRSLCRAGLHDITSPAAWRVGPHGRQCAACYDTSRKRARERRSEARRMKREAGRPDA